MPHTGAAEKEGQGRVGSENPVVEAAGAIRERSKGPTVTAAATAITAPARDAAATGDDHEGHDGATEGDAEADGRAQGLHAE